MFLTRDQSRALDRRVIEEIGVPGVVLMENAGRGAAELLLRLGAQGPVVVCCGKGNNGGDGFVIARWLDNAGVAGARAAVRPAGRPDRRRRGHAPHPRPQRPADRGAAGPDVDEEALRDELASADWVVDALFGSGLQGPVRPPFDRIIEAINASGARVLAVDIPSGLDADTGEPVGPTIRRMHTATIAAAKKGFARPDAAAWLGQVHVIDMGAPRRVVEIERRSRSPDAKSTVFSAFLGISAVHGAEIAGVRRRSGCSITGSSLALIYEDAIMKRALLAGCAAVAVLARGGTGRAGRGPGRHQQGHRPRRGVPLPGRDVPGAVPACVTQPVGAMVLVGLTRWSATPRRTTPMSAMRPRRAHSRPPRRRDLFAVPVHPFPRPPRRPGRRTAPPVDAPCARWPARAPTAAGVVSPELPESEVRRLTNIVQHPEQVVAPDKPKDLDAKPVRRPSRTCQRRSRSKSVV